MSLARGSVDTGHCAPPKVGSSSPNKLVRQDANNSCNSKGGSHEVVKPVVTTTAEGTKRSKNNSANSGSTTSVTNERG